MQVRAAEERYTPLLAEREQQTKLAEASTRAMIARELHRYRRPLPVGHDRPAEARAAATRKPEVAAEALDTIAETGREALHEMRRIVGVLRSDPHAPEPPNFSPMPTLGDIPDPGGIAVLGPGAPRRPRLGRSVPQALSLTIYRVTQEALTNFLKHAGPNAHATVTLTYSRSSITVDVQDDGEGIENPTDGGGNGLAACTSKDAPMGGTLVRPNWSTRLKVTVRDNTVKELTDDHPRASPTTRRWCEAVSAC